MSVGPERGSKTLGESGPDDSASIDPDVACPARHDLPDRLLAIATRLGELRGTSARDELFALQAFDRNLHWSALARELGLEFVADPEPCRLAPGFVPSRALGRAAHAWVPEDGERSLLIAPGAAEIPHFVALLARHTWVAARVRVAPPEAIRRLILDAVMGLHHLDRQKGGCPSE